MCEKHPSSTTVGAAPLVRKASTVDSSKAAWCQGSSGEWLPPPLPTQPQFRTSTTPLISAPVDSDLFLLAGCRYKPGYESFYLRESPPRLFSSRPIVSNTADIQTTQTILLFMPGSKATRTSVKHSKCSLMNASQMPVC
jgi:hypothetical protein